jgi:serine/threonine protein kinase
MNTDELAGLELEHYRLDRVLGQGGMGVVYAGEDQALRRPVAIKVLLPRLLEDAKARQRFQQEIEHAVATEHPHVVPIYGAGYDKRHFFLAMRLINGPDAATELRRNGPFDEQRALRLLGQVSSALHAVHHAGLVHRDIKPHNILLGALGEPDEHAVLTDFGIAKALDQTSNLTAVGAIGTPNYMAPEVCLGQPASPASDQYSLACMAYELLSGVLPYASSDAAPRDAHVNASPRPLQEVAPHTSVWVANAIERGLAKDAADRWPDVRQLANVDSRSGQSFDEATALTKAIQQATDESELVHSLVEGHQLSDQTIATMTDLPKSDVIRLRRRAARQALLGPSGESVSRRQDGTQITKRGPGDAG